MRRWFHVAALALACCAGGQRATCPPTHANAAEVLGWVLPYEDSLASLRRNADLLTVVSPTYFRLAISGDRAHLEDWDPEAPFPRARLEGIQRHAAFEVLPLVGCVDACGPKISRILDDGPARRRHIDDLVRVVREQHLAGLLIDYEELDASEESVTAFVRDLASRLQRDGKRLGVAVQEPCGIDPTCRRAPFPFALGTIARLADLLVVMEYDFAVDGSAPPAPRAWVERGLTKAVSAIDDRDKKKLLCGVPLYGRVSADLSGGDTAVLFRDVQPDRIGGAKVTLGPLSLDPEALSKVAAVRSDTGSGTLYLEDRETLAARLALASSYEIGGVALWRLGGEDPCTSRELARLRGKPPPPCE